MNSEANRAIHPTATAIAAASVGPKQRPSARPDAYEKGERSRQKRRNGD